MPKRVPPRLALLALLVAATGLTPVAGRVMAEDGPPGITAPVVLPPFDPSAPACALPSGLSRTLAFVQENDRDFLEGANHGLSMAAADRGLDYRRVLADSDSSKAAAEISALVDGHVGAIVAAPAGPAIRAAQEAIWSGAYVGTIVPPPATLLLNAPQYQTGEVLAEAAADYIENKLGGTAKVVLLTQDTMQFLAPRFQAMRDRLSRLPGVKIVADIAPDPVTEQGGYDTMTTVLAAIPDVDVILGADAVVLGALRALREQHKDRPDQFLGGIDGEPQAVTEIKAGNGPYKASIALNSAVFGFAMGQFGADWLEGRSIPQAMDVLPIALTADNIAAYEADLDNPAPAFADPVRRAAYLRMYGNICYDTRDQYLNFPWSSENR